MAYNVHQKQPKLFRTHYLLNIINQEFKIPSRAIPYDFDAYRHTSQTLYDVLISYTTHIEAVSCDEALLDISDLVAVTGLEPEVIVRHIRDKIKERTGCDASAGKDFMRVV